MHHATAVLYWTCVCGWLVLTDLELVSNGGVWVYGQAPDSGAVLCLA